jgi:phosphoglycolate phosphatase-like HAD superfamily hydrolase
VRAVTIKAVLFDFDGVLTTDKTGSLTTARFLSQRTGIDLARVQSVLRNFTGVARAGAQLLFVRCDTEVAAAGENGICERY